MDELRGYVALESPDGSAVEAQRFKFLRTAKVEAREYWIWSFKESDASRAYVTVSRSAEGVEIGYSPDFHDLTPEQFMLGDYHGVF
jgi:hypothetical protein